jgi:hypothetical protein
LPTVFSASANLAVNRSFSAVPSLARWQPIEEGDVDVGADVVVADQPFLAAAVDLDGLDR